MKLYSTEYALTQGIQEVEVIQIFGEESPLFITVSHKMDSQQVYIDEKNRNFHQTKEDAVKRAEEMRQKALKTLDAQRQKLADLVFY
jgi:hypothetical protein